jgi:large subunit ribosomal protein L44e
VCYSTVMFVDTRGPQAKTTKKVVLRLECTVCKYKAQLSLKRCKQYVSHDLCHLVSRPHSSFSFELGGEKKTKGAAIQFVSANRAYCPVTHLTIHLVSVPVILHVFYCFFCANPV